jgi:hypothetical protein
LAHPQRVIAAHKPAAKSMSAAQLVVQFDRAVQALSPGGPTFELQIGDDKRRQAAATLLLGMRGCSDVALARACSIVDARLKGQVMPAQFLIGRVLFILLYAPERGSQTAKEYERRYHWPIFMPDGESRDYDSPWSQKNGQWILRKFYWRIQGGLGNLTNLYEIHSKLPRGV